MTDINKLMATTKPFITDGGFETWLFFQEGFEASEFAAIVLMEDPKARKAMQRYFDGFLHMAAAAETGFILDTNTWRGCTAWAAKLGRSEDELLLLSEMAVEFASEIRNAWSSKVSSILLNGVVGPSGDGYAPEEIPSVSKSRELHRPQIGTLARSGVDMLSAITITNIEEATGIVLEAQSVNLPCVIAFTLETDGKLPTGDTLEEAIQAVDNATNNGPLYYMINCAHPDHFNNILSGGQDWVSRLGGVRANASRLSHAELDDSEVLDQGDPTEFGLLNAELYRSLPSLRVIGGCCGTDHRHIECISQHLHSKIAA